MSTPSSGTPSSYLPINTTSLTAPTPQNTPLNTAPITSQLSRPTVPDISEDDDEDEQDPTKSAAAKQAILGMVQGKLATLVGKSSGYIESLPVSVKRRVEGLKGVQGDYAKIEREYKLEMIALDRKYLGLYNPVFKRRHAILSGEAEPTPEEIKAGEEQSLKDDPDTTPLPAKDEDGAGNIKGIPEFWLTALRNHVGISDLITERDEGALRHLTDISYEYLEPSSQGFKLLFTFSPNEYFEDAVLTKEYLYQDEIGYGGDFVYDHAVGTNIKWKEDKDLTKDIEIKRQRNKNTNRTRVIKRTHPTASFFNFFTPPVPPSDQDIENDEVDATELEEIEERLELDYQIGEDIKERIIPRAVDYFTGKALEYEGISELDEDDDEDFEDEDEDDFDEDDDDDDDDGEPVRKRRGGAKITAAGGEGNVDPAECKQQ